MRRPSVVALATAALLALGGLTATSAQAAAASSAPTFASASSQQAVVAVDTKKKKKKKKKKRKHVVASTFSNPTPAKKPAKKPAAKPATRPVKPAVAKPAKPTTPGVDGSLRGIDLARGNRESRNMRGWAPSLYQGKWFRPKVEKIRRCIMDRESNFSYSAVGAGTYFGAYQMNRNLANGATFTMENEVRAEMGAEGVRILRALRTVTPNHWNRYWQDRAFYTIWRNGAGKGNWRGGGLNCF